MGPGPEAREARAPDPRVNSGPALPKSDFLTTSFLQFWSFHALRIVRIDPSRQVSMTQARAGLPSVIWGLKWQKNVKKHQNDTQTRKYPKNINIISPMETPYGAL